jgi:O-antigen/teichoic acid export membrane protein
MNALRSAVRRVKGSESGRFLRDTFYVGLWQSSTSVAELVQIALVTHSLGLSDYGRLAIVIAFVTIVGQLFDVRVGVAATTLGSDALRRGGADAAGTFQLVYLIDAVTGLLGFIVAVALAPIVGPWLVGPDGTELIVLYATTLLAGTLDESSISILRLLDRFRAIASVNAASEAVRVALVLLALVAGLGLQGVIIALLVYRLALGSSLLVLALASFRSATGYRLTRRAPSAPREERARLLRMVMHTNVVSYSRLAQQQLPPLVLGAASTATEVGLYKLGMAAASLIGRLADPAYAALLPRLSNLRSEERWPAAVRLVRRSTAVAVPTAAVATAALLLLREPVLTGLGGGSDALEAQPVLVLGAIAYAMNAALFWNIGVLFAAQRAAYVSKVAVVGFILQTALLVPLAAALGAAGAAATYMLSVVVTNSLITRGALQSLREETAPRRLRPRVAAASMAASHSSTARSSES